MPDEPKPDDVQQIKETPFRDDIETDPPAPRGLWLSSLIRRAVCYLMGWDGSQWRRLLVASDSRLKTRALIEGQYGDKILPMPSDADGCPYINAQMLLKPGTTWMRWRGDTDGNGYVFTKPDRTNAIYAATVSVPDSNTYLVLSKSNRTRAFIRNVGSEPVYVSGTSYPDASNAFRLDPGDEIEMRYTGTIFAACATSGQSTDVAYIQETHS